jgi:DNA modification methylase
MLLSPNSFHTGKNITYIVDRWRDTSSKEGNEWYKNRPLLNEIPVRRQEAKRYYGCNAYFTRQTWNVVQEYIKHFSQHGDLILDPFSGSGITGTEALMTERRSINVDINPMAIFINKSLIAPINTNELIEVFDKIKNEYLKKVPKTDEKIEKTLKKYKLPKDLLLPKGSDVNSVHKLFSKKQLAQLALLKSLIIAEKNDNIKKSLLLAFYNTLTVCNLTFHETPRSKGLGGYSFVVYYRYRIPSDPLYLPIIEVFEQKVKRILNGKKEMRYCINEHTINNAQVIKGTATDLHFIENESVDYIYTDPPYGKKIPYLDLSVMWNAWLDLDVSEEDYKLEAIEGGVHYKSKQSYNDLIAQSIKEMSRVLKFDRWMSFVFAHKDPEFWHLIINTAESCGFEYAGAVSQKNGQSSFKKWQNPFTVLSGQLIINFRKVRNPRAIMNANLGMTTGELLMQSIEGIIAKNNGATLEQINDEIIIRSMELGFLHRLAKEYSDLTPILRSSFDYNAETELYTIRKGSKLTAHIPLDLRIKYYLTSYFLETERTIERKERTQPPTFDEIILHVLPMLKNGDTPENQTILAVLEDIADRVDDNRWQLKQNGQGKLNI